MERTSIVMATDGACSGNPGPGGYAAKLRFGENWKEISGYESRTTNNRMEIRACVEGIRILKKPCNVKVRTDSQVLCNAIANLDKRANNGWKTKTGAKCSNIDLLQQLYNLKKDGNHEIFYEYVPGHSGDPDNERCDELAKEEIRLHAG